MVETNGYLPVIISNEVPAQGGAPVQRSLAQETPDQATGFKASKSIITQPDGHTRTEYRLDVGGTHTVAAFSDDGSISLSTTRGNIYVPEASSGNTEQRFEAVLGTALHHAPRGATPQQEAQDLATVMERAFSSGRIAPREIALLTELNNVAQELPARGPRTGSVTR